MRFDPKLAVGRISIIFVGRRAEKRNEATLPKGTVL
jgi:hypothetical protein